jgi:hypothetical protein
MDHDCFFKRQITLIFMANGPLKNCLQPISFMQRKSIVARNERFDSGYEKRAWSEYWVSSNWNFLLETQRTCFAR